MKCLHALLYDGVIKKVYEFIIMAVQLMEAVLLVIHDMDIYKIQISQRLGVYTKTFIVEFDEI